METGDRYDVTIRVKCAINLRWHVWHLKQKLNYNLFIIVCRRELMLSIKMRIISNNNLCLKYYRNISHCALQFIFIKLSNFVSKRLISFFLHQFSIRSVEMMTHSMLSHGVQLKFNSFEWYIIIAFI